jgi:hypothetical protein
MEVGWRAQDEAFASCDTCQGRVHQPSHPESHIDTLLDEVDLGVVLNDLEAEPLGPRAGHRP